MMGKPNRTFSKSGKGRKVSWQYMSTVNANQQSETLGEEKPQRRVHQFLRNYMSIDIDNK